MKKNDYLLLTAVAAYSFLFYNQNAGINFLLFDIAMISVFIIRDKTLLRAGRWLLSAILTLIAGTGIFVTSSDLAVFSNCCFLLLLSGCSLNPRNSFLLSVFFSAFSVLSGYIWMVLDAIKRKKSKSNIPSKGHFRVVAIAASVLLGFIFLAIYKSANPLFAENTKWINLDFISLNWILFTAGGFFLMYPLYYHKTIAAAESLEMSRTDKLATHTGAGERQNSENFAGIILFAMLNMMLLLLNYGDVSTLWFNRALPKGISHSDFVHNGVGMLILSIIIATSIILYLFRKNYSDLKNSSVTRTLIYLWMFQNVLMLVSTCMRNQLYIHDFNLTYKRIGVYVWLALAFIGILVLFVKVLQVRSNWFLIRTNFFVWLIVLAGCSLIDWDLMITRYNLGNKPVKDVDFYYLFQLSDTNIPELLKVTEQENFGKLNQSLKNFTSDYFNRYYQRSYLDLLNTKIYRYVYTRKDDWRSYDLRDKRITNALNMK